MSSEKISRKEIREPDKFLKVTTDLWEKAAKYQKIIGISLGALVAVFLIASLVSHASGKKDVAAGGALSAALELSRRGVEGSFDFSSDPDAPKFASNTEKYQQLAAALEKVRAEHAGSLAARTAGYYLADADYQLGKLDEADKAYEEFVKQAPEGDPLRVLALEGRGYVAESKKSWATAQQYFGQMAQEAAGDPMKARAAFHRARVLSEEGKKQEAAEAFQKLKDDYKESAAARQATERLALLSAEGIKPPAAKPTEPTSDKQ